MQLDVYGRMTLAINRHAASWHIAIVGEDGKQRPVTDFVIPPDYSEQEVLQFIADMYHEYASPGATIKRIE